MNAHSKRGKSVIPICSHVQ